MIDFEQLRRWPDVEAPELVAHDATDRLLLDAVAGALVADPGPVAVVGDRYGALTLGTADLIGASRTAAGPNPASAPALRVHQDSRSGEDALAANAARLGVATTWAHHGLDAALFAGASTVVVQLPRGLDALDEIAELVAAHAAPDVRLVAGGGSST